MEKRITDLKKMREDFRFEFNIEFVLGYDNIEGLGKVRIIDVIDKVESSEVRIYNSRDVIKSMGYASQDTPLGKNGTTYTKIVRKYCNEEDNCIMVYNSDLKTKVKIFDSKFKLGTRGDLYMDKTALNSLLSNTKLNTKFKNISV